MKPKYLLLAAFILISQSLHALPDSLNVAQWAKALSDKNDKKNLAYSKLDSLLNPKDSSYTFRFLDELEKQGKPDDNYFQARFNLLKGRKFYWLNSLIGFASATASKEADRLLAIAMDKAYASEDDYLIVFVSKWYWRSTDDVGLMVMYNLNYITLSEKLSLPVTDFEYNSIAEMMYGVGAYSDCIQYANKAIETGHKSHDGRFYNAKNCFNTIGLAYQKQQQYDSALKYYRLALQADNETNIGGWDGIVSGNMGQVYYVLGKYDSAYALLKKDYDTAISHNWADESANALQWLARTNLASGNTGKALAEVRQAFQELQSWRAYQPSYVRNIYYTKTLVFKEMKEYDSAFYYNNLYSALNDSLEKEVAANSLSVSKARLGDLNSRYKIQALNREKQAELTTRNMMIGGVTLVALVALLIINRRRLKAKHEQEKAEQEKLLMQQQMVSAQEQLKMFTENIVEKSAIIEKLEQQQQTKPGNDEQQTIVKEIIHQSILTEDDWLQFKALFEKAHPGFFDKLREQVNDISLAEVRMAALTRLKLTTKQMADVLGISTNSIFKAKQRLRQRFNLPTNYEVETFIAKL